MKFSNFEAISDATDLELVGIKDGNNVRIPASASSEQWETIFESEELVRDCTFSKEINLIEGEILRITMPKTVYFNGPEQAYTAYEITLETYLIKTRPNKDNVITFIPYVLATGVFTNLGGIYFTTNSATHEGAPWVVAFKKIERLIK